MGARLVNDYDVEFVIGRQNASSPFKWKIRSLKNTGGVLHKEESASIQDAVASVGRLLRPVGEIMQHVVDSHNGIYSPQVFVERYQHYIRPDLKTPARNEYLNEVLRGPDDPNYWESWEELVNYIVITDDDDIEWTVYEDEGIYLIRNDLTLLENSCLFDDEIGQLP